MQADVDLKQIRHKVYMSYFQDGLWDIFLGFFLLGWGFTVWLDFPWLPGAIFVGFFWLVLGLKKKIIYPRIGHATPAEQRNRTLKIAIAGVVVLVAVMLLLPIVVSGEVQLLRNNFEFIFGSMIALAVALIGYWWQVTRWYPYAALVFIFFVAQQWLGLPVYFAFAIPGAIITVSGVALLGVFLRRYPRPAGGEVDSYGG